MKIITATALILALGMISAPAAHSFIIRGADKTLDSPAYRVRGTDYLPLSLICDAYGAQWQWDSVSRTAELTRGASTLRLQVGEYRVCANGSVSTQEKPVIFYNGAVCVPSDFLRTIFNKIFQAMQAPKYYADIPKDTQRQAPSSLLHHKIRRIVLDAGHGGYDPGAIGRGGLKEKFINLDIAKKIQDLLECEGIDVIMTRSSDRFIPLWERVQIANDKGADLFVSVHTNASKTKRLAGFEVYYLTDTIDDSEKARKAADKYTVGVDAGSVYTHTNDLDAILWDLELTENRKDSIALADCILEEVNAGRERVKSAKFFVLKGALMPAVLVEVGYITNVDEYLKLKWEEHRSKIARQVASGILNFKKLFESSDGFVN